MMERLVLTMIIILSIPHRMNSAKILLLTAPSTSHCMEKMAIGQELLKRGHHVTLYPVILDPKNCVSRFNAQTFKPRFKTIIPNLDHSYKKLYEDVELSVQKHVFERSNVFVHILPLVKALMEAQCEGAFIDKEALQVLQNDKYDVAVVDGVAYAACLFTIPYYLGIPTVVESALTDPQESMMPLQANVFPHFATAYSNHMTFFQRCVNTLLFLLTPLMKTFLVPVPDLSHHSEKLRGINGADLIKDSLLFLDNSDYVVDYPRAIFPNNVEVGGLTATPANPLPADLKSYMDAALTGVVIVTFGSRFKLLPAALLQKLMTAFSRLDHQVLFRQDRNEIRGNVRLMKWLPQNDILGHPNTKLFISHCGKNSFWEAAFHGVPVICVPVNSETYITVVKVKKYGIGSAINLFEDNAEDMAAVIHAVLENTSVSQNMKRVSTLLKDRPESPTERAASAIEHVLKYGGDHMRPPSVNQGFFSYICLDVWFTVYILLTGILLFDVWVIRKCFSCRRQIKTKSKTE